MKKLQLVKTSLLALGLISGSVMAATQGSLGTDSTGTVDITVDINDLVFNKETGLFEEPTESDLQTVQDRKTEEQIRAQCVPLLEKSDGKIATDNDEADIEKWKAWRKSIRAIVKNPLSYVGQEIPAAHFPVAWDPKGRLFVSI